MKANPTRLAALVIVLFSAAVQAAAPEDTVAKSQAAIINALVAGASIHAPAELKLARETLDLSRRAVARKEFSQAQHLARVAGEAARAAEARSVAQRDFVRTASH